MDYTVIMKLSAVVALIAGIALLVVGLILGSRGKKEKSEKYIKWFGAVIFLSAVFGVFIIITEAGRDKTNNSVSDTLAGIYDTVKTGGFLDKDARPEEGNLYVHYIDVGDGEATLLDYKQNGERKSILIDMGRAKGTEVEEYLKGLRIRGLDILVGTNTDLDHLGEVQGLVNRFRINEVWMSKGENTSSLFGMVKNDIEQKEITYYEPSVGEEYVDGELKITTINPATREDDSIGLKVTFGEVGFIFTSDSPGSVEMAMLNTGADVKSSILQLGNHGKGTSTTVTFLEAVDPSIAIYSSSEGANEKVVERLEEYGVKVYGTDKDGTIRVSTDGKTFNVSKMGKQELKEKEKVDINIIDPIEVEDGKGSNKLAPIQIEKNDK